ncbi:hypothetical protein P3X46_028105, partial [Hevea brasiliensis]
WQTPPLSPVANPTTPPKIHLGNHILQGLLRSWGKRDFNASINMQKAGDQRIEAHDNFI